MADDEQHRGDSPYQHPPGFYVPFLRDMQINRTSLPQREGFPSLLEWWEGRKKGEARRRARQGWITIGIALTALVVTIAGVVIGNHISPIEYLPAPTGISAPAQTPAPTGGILP